MIESQHRGGPRINNAEIAHILAGTGDVGYTRRANLEAAGGVDAPAHLAPLPAAYTAPRGTSMDRPFPSSPCPAHQLRLLTRTLTGRYGSGAPAVDAARKVIRSTVHLRRPRSLGVDKSTRASRARGAGSLGEVVAPCGGRHCLLCLLRALCTVCAQLRPVVARGGGP